jgi:hypothetical protein
MVNREITHLSLLEIISLLPMEVVADRELEEAV